MVDYSKMSMFNRLANVKKENNYSDNEVLFVLEHLSFNKKESLLDLVMTPRTKRPKVITFYDMQPMI